MSFRMMAMALLALTVSAQVQAADKYSCKIKETAGAPADEPAQESTLTVDNGKAVIDANGKTVNCDAIADQKSLTDAATAMRDGFGLVLTAKLLVTCKGRTPDETVTLLLMKDAVPKVGTNALLLSPVVGFLGVGSCEQK